MIQKILQPSDNEASSANERVMSRRRCLVELVLLLSVFEWVLWTDSRQVLPKPARTANSVLLAAVVIGLLWRQRPSLRTLGLAPTSWLGGTTSLALFTLVASALVVLTGHWAGTIGNVEDFAHWLKRNWYLEGLQQLLLQVLLIPRLLVLTRGRTAGAVVAAAVVFSLLHAPNWPLMALTLPASFIWCAWFLRHANLLALWVSHLVLAATVLYCLNGPALGMLRVGIGYVYR